MKKLLSGFILVFLFYSSASAQFAQNTWGLGVGIISGGAVFHVPIIFDKIRIEPEIGFRTSSSNSASTTFENYPTEASTSNYASSNSTLSISMGIGGYYSFRIDNSADWYIGPRFGFTRSSSVSDNSSLYRDVYTDSTSINFDSSHVKQHALSFFAGVVFGGEYYLSSHFSAGAEVQVTYTYTGQPVIDEESHILTPIPSYHSISVPGPSSSSSLLTSTAVYIRWYF
jgi:hypothetical protein